MKLALPDKYNPLFSDENQPQPSTSQPLDLLTSGPSQQGPVVKSDISSPKRILRSSQTSPQSSPSTQPRRKRKFLQPISDSDDEDIPPPSPPPVKNPRKEVKATNITDLTVDPPQSEDTLQALVPFSDQPQATDPVLVEPISAMPLEEPGTTAAIPLSETTPDLSHKSDDLSAATPTLNQDTLVKAEVQEELILNLNQESLIQNEEHDAVPVQEISYAVNSDAAIEALLLIHSASLLMMMMMMLQRSHLFQEQPLIKHQFQSLILLQLRILSLQLRILTLRLQYPLLRSRSVKCNIIRVCAKLNLLLWKPESPI